MVKNKYRMEIARRISMMLASTNRTAAKQIVVRVSIFHFDIFMYSIARECICIYKSFYNTALKNKYTYCTL